MENGGVQEQNQSCDGKQNPEQEKPGGLRKLIPLFRSSVQQQGCIEAAEIQIGALQGAGVRPQTEKPQEQNDQRLGIIYGVSDIAQSSRAKAELRTAAPANGSRACDQVDAVLQGSPRRNRGVESHRARPKRRHVKRASADELMDISIIIPVEDCQDGSELMETIMTRTAAHGAPEMLREPMLAQEEEEGVKYARLYRKGEPSGRGSPDTKEARNELTQQDLEFRAAETSRRQEVRSIMSKSTDPKLFDQTTNMWQKYPEAVVKDVVLNIRKARGESDYNTLDTRRSSKRRPARPIKVELSVTAPSTQRTSLAATKKLRSSRRGKAMTMHSTQMELEDYAYQAQLNPRAKRKIYPHVLSGSDYCSMRYQHIVKNLNISELADNFKKQKEDQVKEELLRLQNEKAEEQPTPMQRSISNNTHTHMKSNFDSGTFDYVSEQVWHAKMKQTQQDYGGERISDRYKGGLSRGLAESWQRKSNEVKIARRAHDEGAKSPGEDFELYGQQSGPSEEAKGGSHRRRNEQTLFSKSFNTAKHSVIEAIIPAAQERTAEVAGQTSYVGTLTEHQSELKLMQELSGQLLLSVKQPSTNKIGAANAVGQKGEQAAETGDAGKSRIPDDYRSDLFHDKFIRYSKPHTYAPHLQKALQRLLDSRSGESPPQTQGFDTLHNTPLACPQVPGTTQSNVVDLNGQIAQSFDASNMQKFAKFDQQISMRIRNTTRLSEDSARITEHEPVGTIRIRPNSPTDVDQLNIINKITAKIGRQSDHDAPPSRDQATGAESREQPRVLAVKHTHISEEISSNQTSHYCIVTDPDARPDGEGDDEEGDPMNILEMKEDDDHGGGLTLELHQGGNRAHHQSKPGNVVAMPQLRLQKADKHGHSPLGLLWEQQPIKNMEPLASALAQSPMIPIILDPSHGLASKAATICTTLNNSHHSSSNAIHEVSLPEGYLQGKRGHTGPSTGCASPARAKKERPVEYKTSKEIVRVAIMKGNHGRTSGRHSKLMRREMKRDLTKGSAASEGHSMPKSRQVPSAKQKQSARRVREGAKKPEKPIQSILKVKLDSKLKFENSDLNDRVEVQAEGAAMTAAQEVWALQARAAETLQNLHNYEFKPAAALPSQPLGRIERLTFAEKTDEEEDGQKAPSVVHTVNKIHLSDEFGASHEDLHVNEQATDQTWLQGTSPSPRLTSCKRLALANLPFSGADRSPRVPQGGTSRRRDYGLQQILDDENSLNSSRMQAQTLDLSTVNINIGEASADRGKVPFVKTFIRPPKCAEVTIKHSRGDAEPKRLSGTNVPKNQIIIERIREMESLEEVQNLRRTLQENIIQMSGLQRENANKSPGAGPDAARAQVHSSLSASPQILGRGKFPSRGGSPCERRSVLGQRMPGEGDQRLSQESQRETMRTAAGGGAADLPLFGAGWSTRPPKVLKEKVPGRSPAASALGHRHKSRTLEQQQLRTIDHQSLKIDNSPDIEGRQKEQEKKLDNDYMSLPVHSGTSPISDRSLLLDLDYMAVLSANLELLQIKEQELKDDRERDYVSRNIQMHAQELAGFHRSEVKPMEYKFQGPTFPPNEQPDGMIRRISTTNQKLLHMFKHREGRQFASLSQQQKDLRMRSEAGY